MAETRTVLHTGIQLCYDENGTEISCHKTLQDANSGAGDHWPDPRFIDLDEYLVRDQATGLIWTRKATLSEYPMNWQEALAMVAQMNDDEWYGRKDYRLPNRRELRSLIDHGMRKPALPADHPFTDIFLGWYWTSTSAALAPRYAWYLHLEGGRMFYGKKTEPYWIWPVCGRSDVLPATGESHCRNTAGEIVDCENTGQDGEMQMGVHWPQARFQVNDHGIYDSLTGRTWQKKAILDPHPATWQEALTAVEKLAAATGRPWRLPTINELESLVDAAAHSPALPDNHPFTHVHDGYWSSTTSGFETAWAYVLYLRKGAVGVGYKKNRDFTVWPVMNTD